MKAVVQENICAITCPPSLSASTWDKTKELMMNIKIPMITASLESQKAVIEALTAACAAINYSG